MENSIRFPHLLKSEIFDGLDVSAKKDFLNTCNMIRHSRPTVIYEQGYQASGVMILAHGYVDVTYIGEGGVEMFVIRLKSGTAIGEMEVISEEPCLATCKTSSNAILLECPEKQLYRFLQRPVFLKNMIRAFYRRLAYVNWSKYMAQFGSVDDGLRGYLYVLSEHTKTVRETQTNLAKMVGCSRQTINRELSALREAGLIEQAGSEITVLDRVQLAEGLVHKRDKAENAAHKA